VAVGGGSRVVEAMIQRALDLCQEFLRTPNPSDCAEGIDGRAEASEDGCGDAVGFLHTRRAHHSQAWHGRGGLGGLAIGLSRMAFRADGEYCGDVSRVGALSGRGDAVGADAGSNVGERAAADRLREGLRGPATPSQRSVQAAQHDAERGREREGARVDTALKTLLQDLGRVLVRMRDRWPDSGEWFPAAAAQVLDGMVWVRAAAPFTLLDAVAASLTPPQGILMQGGSKRLPSFKIMTSLLSSFAHFDHLDVRLLAAAVAVAKASEHTGSGKIEAVESGSSNRGQGLAGLEGAETLKLAEALTSIARSEGHMPVPLVPHSLDTPGRRPHEAQV